MRRFPAMTWFWAVPLLALSAMLVLGFGPGAGPKYAGQSLQDWLGQLVGDDYQARLRAEMALRGMGREALPYLVRVVDSRRSRVMDVCHRGWQTMFPTDQMRPSRDMLALAAARLLSGFGREAAPAAPALVRMLTEGSPAAGREAGAALRRIGAPATAALAQTLARGGSAAQGQVLRLLADSGDTDLGAAATNLIADVVRLGSAPDVSLRVAAVAAVVGLRVSAGQAVPFLLGRLEDSDARVRCAAATAVGTYGPAGSPALQRLLALVDGGSTQERLAAAGAFWEISQDGALVMPRLTAMLEEEEFRSSAAMVLGRMGPDAAAAVPPMLKALALERTHRPSRTPSMVAVALSKVGPVAVPGLVELLRHDGAEVRLNAAFALRGHGSDASPAVPALQQMLRAQDAEERMTAATTLAAIGPAAREAEPELLRLADETSGDVIVGHVASAARDALRRIRGSGLDRSRNLP